MSSRRLLLFIPIFIPFILLLLFPSALISAAPDSPSSSSVIIPSGSPIEIAVANSLVIPAAADVPLAVEMAVADYGPIHGFSVQTNDFDSGCSTPTGGAAAVAIVANPQHVGVLGPLCSSSAIGALPVLETAGMVMVTGSATQPGLEINGPNVFNRTVTDDSDFAHWDLQISGLSSVASWEAGFSAMHGHVPWEIAKYAYDASQVLLSAIEQVGTVDGGGNLVIDRAELATAVRGSLNRSGVTGSIALDAEGTRINQFETSVWAGEFDGPNLESEWSWIDEDPTHWSLSANPGFLRIITQSPAQNRLVQPVPMGDFEIRARVLFTPTENFQFAGISVYTDGNNFLNLGRAYCDLGPPNCLDNAIYFDFVEGGVFIPPNYAITTTVQTEATLRLVRTGNDFTAYVSENGTAWQMVGTHTVSFSPMYVGLYAAGQSSLLEIPADFDFFVIESAAWKAFMPLSVR